MNRKSLFKKLDDLSGEVVKQRDGQCLICGKSYNLDKHHFIITKGASTKHRWNLKNLITLCRECHTKVHAVLSLKEVVRKSAIEKNQVLSSILKAQNKYSTVLNMEFEEYKYGLFDRVIMNPPFSQRLDAKHITKAFNEHLKICGVLVAIHSSSITSATDKYSKEFQSLCNKYMVERVNLDSGEFKESGKGTMVSSCITKLVKKENLEVEKVESKNQLELF